MTNALVSQLEAAAIPTAITALEAFQQFETDLGPDPAQWGLNFPGAKLKFLGTLSLQIPVLAKAEGGALLSAANSQAATWITQLKAKQLALAAPTTAAIVPNVVMAQPA